MNNMATKFSTVLRNNYARDMRNDGICEHTSHDVVAAARIVGGFDWVASGDGIEFADRSVAMRRISDGIVTWAPTDPRPVPARARGCYY